MPWLDCSRKAELKYPLMLPRRRDEESRPRLEDTTPEWPCRPLKTCVVETQSQPGECAQQGFYRALHLQNNSFIIVIFIIVLIMVYILHAGLLIYFINKLNVAFSKSLHITVF